MTLAELITRAPVIFGDLGLAALGVKVDDTRTAKAERDQAETVSGN